MSEEPKLWKDDAPPPKRATPTSWSPVGFQRLTTVAVLLVLLGAGLWWWTSRVPARSGQAEQAIVGLKNLRAATQAGLAFDAYRTRLLDARVLVNRYTETPARAYETNFRVALEDASRLYGEAGEVWAVKIRAAGNREAFADVAAHPVVAACPALAEFVATAVAEPSTLPSAMLRGIAVANGIPFIWKCAEARLTEADQAWPAPQP